MSGYDFIAILLVIGIVVWLIVVMDMFIKDEDEL